MFITQTILIGFCVRKLLYSQQHHYISLTLFFCLEFVPNCSQQLLNLLYNFQTQNLVYELQVNDNTNATTPSNVVTSSTNLMPRCTNANALYSDLSMFIIKTMAQLRKMFSRVKNYTESRNEGVPSCSGSVAEYLKFVHKIAFKKLNVEKLKKGYF